MGLLYTKFYMDFDENEWKQISTNPIIEDTSHKSYKLIFKNGAKFHMFRVTGKFRLTWNNDDIV